MPELGTSIGDDTQIPHVTEIQFFGGSHYSGPTRLESSAQSRQGFVTRFNTYLVPVAVAATSFFIPQGLVSENVYLRRKSTTQSMTIGHMWAADFWAYSPELITEEQAHWLDALFALPAPPDLPSYPTLDE
jgi:hypothetical protein